MGSAPTGTPGWQPRARSGWFPGERPLAQPLEHPDADQGAGADAQLARLAAQGAPRLGRQAHRHDRVERAFDLDDNFFGSLPGVPSGVDPIYLALLRLVPHRDLLSRSPIQPAFFDRHLTRSDYAPYPTAPVGYDHQQVATRSRPTKEGEP